MSSPYRVYLYYEKKIPLSKIRDIVESVEAYSLLKKKRRFHRNFSYSLGNTFEIYQNNVKPIMTIIFSLGKFLRLLSPIRY